MLYTKSNVDQHQPGSGIKLPVIDQLAVPASALASRPGVRSDRLMPSDYPWSGRDCQHLRASVLRQRTVNDWETCAEQVYRSNRERSTYDSSQPPSTSMVVPVTKSFWIMNMIPCATSSAVPARGMIFPAVFFA